MKPYKAVLLFCLLSYCLQAHAQNYPQYYFRSPLDIPMQLVANFGELRANHWHMGLDVRTDHRENLPVHAAADGYIAAVSIDATGFGRAIYINHPNGYTTLYGHLNNFAPALQAWVKAQQYKQQKWAVKLEVPEDLFPVKKGQFIAYSGNTGGSQGPHVHFEIRDTKTEKVLNPLLFGFPIPDAVPPTLLRLAMYDRTKNVYAQSPQIMALRKAGSNYTLAASNLIKTGSDKISFAIGANDKFSRSTNPNGIYSARILVDGVLQSGFVLNNIGYDETRYLNAQIDYRYKASGGSYVQHLSKMPGEASGVYTETKSNGIITLTDDAVHDVLVEVKDANGNTARLAFKVQYDANILKNPYTPTPEQLMPRNVNVFERENFELFTTEHTVYDTVNVAFTQTSNAATGAVSPLFQFLNAGIPVHDSVTVRIKTENVPAGEENHIVIVGTAGEKKAVAKGQWRDGWVSARFRQFGNYQAFIDNIPPTVNAPGYGDTIDLRRATRLVFNPKDNFKVIAGMRAELDGQWLLLTNDKNLAYIYTMDDYFLPGVHQLKVTVQDVAGNTTVKEWWVRR